MYRRRITFPTRLNKIWKWSKNGHFSPFWLDFFVFLHYQRVRASLLLDFEIAMSKGGIVKKIYFLVFKPLIDLQSHCRPVYRRRITFPTSLNKIWKWSKNGHFRPFWLDFFVFLHYQRVRASLPPRFWNSQGYREKNIFLSF